MSLHKLAFFFLSLLLPLFLQAKVYDCFPFFNELELLTMRLEELDGSVDYFVLVESIETQRGDPKPLYFQENKHLFTKFLPKIIHVVIEERHPEMSLWEREHFQREGICRGLKDCGAFDIILISDLDEIPRASVIEEFNGILFKDFYSELMQRCKDFVLDPFVKKEEKKTRRHGHITPAFGLQMPIYFYQLNRIPTTGELWAGLPWIGTVATYYRNVEKRGAQFFRDRRYEFSRIPHGGWHFTWMGGKDKVRQKMASVVEGRSDGATISDAEIEEWIQNFPVVPIDSSFPSYIQNNQSYLRSLGFIAD